MNERLSQFSDIKITNGGGFSDDMLKKMIQKPNLTSEMVRYLGDS